MNNDQINYARIAQAQMYYKALGYKNVEVPWTVSVQAVMSTLPKGANLFQTPKGVLVGSGEQSFIELMLKGQIQPGRYQCTTPCWRDEPEYNELTRFSFFKTELIWYKPEDTKKAFQAVVNDAFACFFEISEVETFEAVQTDEGLDIFFNGIELGL